MLKDVLTNDMIQVKLNAVDWEDAVKQSAIPLIENNKITEKYTEGMIDAVKNMGPYIVIMPGVALAHARPDDSVKEDSMALTTLSEPVYFGSKENDPVHTLFTFASKSNEGHLEYIQNLAMFLSEDENIKMLMESNSKQELLDIIKKY